jgi:hypothetical protein
MHPASRTFSVRCVTLRRSAYEINGPQPGSGHFYFLESKIGKGSFPPFPIYELKIYDTYRS